MVPNTPRKLNMLHQKISKTPPKKRRSKPSIFEGPYVTFSGMFSGALEVAISVSGGGKPWEIVTVQVTNKKFTLNKFPKLWWFLENHIGREGQLWFCRCRDEKKRSSCGDFRMILFGDNEIPKLWTSQVTWKNLQGLSEIPVYEVSYLKSTHWWDGENWNTPVTSVFSARKLTSSPLKIGRIIPKVEAGSSSILIIFQGLLVWNFGGCTSFLFNFSGAEKGVFFCDTQDEWYECQPECFSCRFQAC